jgi:hypothetical protein
MVKRLMNWRGFRRKRSWPNQGTIVVFACRYWRKSIKLFNLFLIGIVGGGVQLGPLSTAATNRSIVLTPGDYDDGEIGGMMIAGRRGGKPATNRLSYGTATKTLIQDSRCLKRITNRNVYSATTRATSVSWLIQGRVHDTTQIKLNFKGYVKRHASLRTIYRESRLNRDHLLT